MFIRKMCFFSQCLSEFLVQYILSSWYTFKKRLFVYTALSDEKNCNSFHVFERFIWPKKHCIY